jgi:hypothetical protein
MRVVEQRCDAAPLAGEMLVNAPRNVELRATFGAFAGVRDDDLGVGGGRVPPTKRVCEALRIAGRVVFVTVPPTRSSRNCSSVTRMESRVLAVPTGQPRSHATSATVASTSAQAYRGARRTITCHPRSIGFGRGVHRALEISG